MSRSPSPPAPASTPANPVPEPGPRLVRRDDALYLKMPVGPRYERVAGWWRVYWVGYGPPHAAPHKRRRLSVGSPRANYLWFVPQDPAGNERCQQLTREMDRTINPEVMSAYLLRAGVPARTRWEPPPSRGLLGS